MTTEPAGGNGLTLRARVALLLAGLTAVLAVVGGVSIVAVSRTRDLDHRLRTNLQLARDDTQGLLVDYIDQQTYLRGYDITGIASLLTSYQSSVTKATKALPALQALMPNDRTRTELATVVTLHQQWTDSQATAQIAAARAGEVATVKSLVAGGVQSTAFGKVRNAVTVLSDDLGRQTDRAVHQADLASQRVFWALGVGAAALLGAIVVAGWLLRRWVLRPTLHLQRQLRTVADGGYDNMIVGTGPPELTALAADAELMRERIVTELDRSRQAIEALYQSGPVVNGLREELAATPSLQLPGLALHGVLSAAEGVLAGDWYDAVVLPGGRTALLVADVSGHGAAAGLVALRVKLSLTSALSLGLGPAAALAHATHTFAGEEERFASCVVLVLDPVAETLTWANAGHPPPLVYTPGEVDGSPYTELEPTGPLLSFFDGGWTERTVPFRHGQLLLGFTDGLTEARDEQGKEFETEGILRALSELPSPNPVAAVVACMAAVRSHAVDLRRDDVTVVAVAHED